MMAVHGHVLFNHATTATLLEQKVTLPAGLGRSYLDVWMLGADGSEMPGSRVTVSFVVA